MQIRMIPRLRYFTPFSMEIATRTLKHFCFSVWNKTQIATLQGTYISHQWRRKLIFPTTLRWNMIVSGRVALWTLKIEKSICEKNMCFSTSPKQLQTGLSCVLVILYDVFLRSALGDHSHDNNAKKIEGRIRWIMVGFLKFKQIHWINPGRIHLKFKQIQGRIQGRVVSLFES